MQDHPKQTVELTLKTRKVGSNYRTLTRTVRVDQSGAYVNYRGQRVNVRTLNKDGIDWVGTVQQ
jgi:hypothetical protein